MDQYKDGFDPARFLQQMDEIPAFLTELPTGEGEDLPPLVAALQSLKYEEDDPDACAANYKDDGNFNFKLKKFRYAVENYDKALQLKVTKPDLLTALYWNRAAANFQLKNYRRTIKDCCEVLKIDPLHIKACYKGAQALFILEKYPEANLWIDNGLKVDDANTLFLELKAKVLAAEKKKIRDDRIRDREAKKLQSLRDAIKQRNIKLTPSNPWAGDSVAKTPSGASVSLREDGSLVWPVRLLFPEVDQQEFLDQVEEDSTFGDILRLVLDENPPPWDEKRAYNTKTARCFFCDPESKSIIYEASNALALRRILSDQNYLVENALPVFIVLSYSSDFCKAKYLSQFEKVVKITD
ncbi:putative Tetratricopeptide repeat protein 4 [Hypsibius exemplaris]|uniref:Tetratricopeptide repeat protein 4 n=1 Tax=Hypsibius exemplaris TaxID=2072580 RepID=A0A9X6NAY2_HYPEX|nr:putative Tetratricopeptide repeat protein 4 [Hypsibius exemplaris]